MLEPEEILAAIEAWAQPKVLAGKRVLLTAGPTFEAIDPVRGITNLSSGKMGFAVARAAQEAGAEVIARDDHQLGIVAVSEAFGECGHQQRTLSAALGP